ncbi:MAG TPA: DUF1552 domain-containing protein, partial [Polyangiaceae bacterium]|nr:DUF1552 domain-containing protein [Polyangiaceae bacterium]
MPRPLTRRQFAQLFAGACTALPLLESVGWAQSAGTSSSGTSAAGASTAPQRLILLFNPNGTITDHFWPQTAASGTGPATVTDFQLGEILKPLASYQSRMLLLKGIDISVADQSGAGYPGGPHQKGLGGLFTGSALQTGKMADGDGSLAGWANGPSIDQAIVQALNPPTLLPSLELGVRAIASDVMGRISYSGPGAPVPPMNDPRDVFQRLNTGFASELDGPDQATARDQRRMVMAAVQAQYKLLRGRVSSTDVQKLDEHADFLNGIVRRLDYGIRPGPACIQPGEPPVLGIDTPTDMPSVMQLQMDLLALALACDLTRVASVQFSTAINAIPFTWFTSADSTAEGHNLSHRGPSDTDATNQLVQRHQWYASQVAYLLGKLAAIPEGNGSVLDNTLVVWGNELSVGNTHSHKSIP